MATIKKRGKGYCVVYDYKAVGGSQKKKWESGFTKEEAEKRKIEVEYEIKHNAFLIPNDITVKDFLLRWLAIHATKKKWTPSTYGNSMGYLNNHIFPHIGNMQLQKITTFQLDTLYDKLSHTKKGQYREGVFQEWDEQTYQAANYISSTTVKEIHDLLRCAFNYAVDWKILRDNPAPREGPKKRKVETAFWDDETMFKALEKMSDPLLHLMIHLIYIGSLRAGEAMAITLDDIDFDYKEIGCIKIDKTLQRVTKKWLEAVVQDDIIKVFPTQMEGKKSCLIIKKPKTDKSKRILFLTEPLKQELKQRIELVEKNKVKYGEYYYDYNLLFCLPNGLPIEPTLCLDRFKAWQAEQNGEFPPLVTHGVRHSSSTYKLILSQGDVKSVQGDTGHATAGLLLDTYAHVQEKSRIKLTQSVENDFYKGAQKPVNTPIVEDNLQDLLVAALKQSPDLQQTLLCAMLSKATNMSAV